MNKKVVVFLLILMIVSSLGIVAARPPDTTDAGKSGIKFVVLENKDPLGPDGTKDTPDDWSVIDDDMWGRVKYQVGSTSFHVTAHGLTPNAWYQIKLGTADATEAPILANYYIAQDIANGDGNLPTKNSELDSPFAPEMSSNIDYWVGFQAWGQGGVVMDVVQANPDGNLNAKIDLGYDLVDDVDYKFLVCINKHPEWFDPTIQLMETELL